MEQDENVLDESLKDRVFLFMRVGVVETTCDLSFNGSVADSFLNGRKKSGHFGKKCLFQS